MNRLLKSLADYNASYGTNFTVSGTYSLSPMKEECYLDNINLNSGKSGIFLLFDVNRELLGIYSTKNFDEGLKGYIKNEKDSLGNWIMKGKWISTPTYLTFIMGNQDKTYEKDSLRTFLIQTLNPRYGENGQLVW